MKQHIHHAEIKAWADGATIEYFDDGATIQSWSEHSECWFETGPNPHWNPGTKYRVRPQPEVVRYRNYLYRDTYGVAQAAVYPYTSRVRTEEFTQCPGFIRWIDNDWQEEVVRPGAGCLLANSY